MSVRQGVVKRLTVEECVNEKIASLPIASADEMASLDISSSQVCKAILETATSGVWAKHLLL